MARENRNTARKKRHLRIRRHVAGTEERPRLNVFRSLNNIYAQVIDDNEGRTIVSASSLDEKVKTSKDRGSNVEAAKLVGEIIAKRATEKGIKKVTFDRGGYKYHGRVAALADAARENGLEF